MLDVLAPGAAADVCYIIDVADRRLRFAQDRRQDRLERGDVLVRDAPACAIALRALIARLAFVARKEGDARERHAVLFEEIGDTAERAAGEARTFIDDGEVFEGADVVAHRAIHRQLAMKRMSDRAQRDESRGVARARDDGAEGRPDGASSVRLLFVGCRERRAAIA